jgi:hypothetical protein
MREGPAVDIRGRGEVCVREGARLRSVGEGVERWDPDDMVDSFSNTFQVESVQSELKSW